MKRKMIGAASAYISGLFFASFFSFKAAFFISAAALLFLITLKMKCGDILMIAVCFTAAVGIMNDYNVFYYDAIISNSGTRGNFEGEIIELRHLDNDLASYTLKGELGGIKNVRISYLGDDTDADYGDRLCLVGCTFEEFENDYLFNSKNYNRSERIFLRADSPDDVTLKKADSRRIKNLLMDYREYMTERFKDSLGNDIGGLLAGMVFGEKQGIDTDTRLDLKSVGLSHIIVVSGLHISLIASLFMTLFKFFRFGKFISFVLVNIVMLLFVIMAGSTVSCIRAAVMTELVVLAPLFGRETDTFNSIAIAAMLICIFDPYAIYSSGFIISVAATFGIGVFGPYMTKNFIEKRLLRKFLVIVCESIFILPFCLYFFGEYTLISPITNMLTITLCSVAISIGSIYVIAFGLLPILPLASLCIRPVLFLSEKLSKLKLAHFSYCTRFSGVILFGLTAMVMLIFVIFGSRRLTAVSAAAAFCAVVVISAASSSAVRKDLRIAVLGKGKNATVVVLYENYSYVFDLTGYYNAPQYVKKYLSENGYRSIDKVILTRREPSQYASYKAASGTLPVKSWLTGGRLYIPNEERTSYYENGFELFIGLAKAEYAENVLEFEQGDSFVTIRYDNKARQVTVITNDEHEKETICVDIGENNFEIKLSDSGSFDIRRL